MCYYQVLRISRFSHASFPENYLVTIKWSGRVTFNNVIVKRRAASYVEVLDKWFLLNFVLFSCISVTNLKFPRCLWYEISIWSFHFLIFCATYANIAQTSFYCIYLGRLGKIKLLVSGFPWVWIPFHFSESFVTTKKSEREV